MIKIFSYILYKLIYYFDYFFLSLAKRSVLIWFKDFIEISSYKEIKILKKRVIFFTPNYITNWLVDTFFTKEPETLEWIDSFNRTPKKIIFWDIGANIGLYSIYAALKHKNIEVISFEPSTSNLRILSRNISINNLENKIKINQFPLSNIKNKYLLFNESNFIEGIGCHTFGKTKDFEGKNFNPLNKYKIFGTSINFLIDNQVLEIPNYIKIDVDGIENLILEGASKYLKNKKIKSISIEINKNYKKMCEQIFKIMNENNFNLKHKKRSKLVENFSDEKYKETYNYLFVR